MDYGIDISHHNAVDDWAAVRGNNITFASMKLTEGQTWVDDAAGAHTAGARGAGIMTGGYHFARPGAIDPQVGHFAWWMGQHGLKEPGNMWPMLDMEDPEIPDPNAFIPEFVRLLRIATGVRGVLVYASLNWFQNIIDPNLWAGDDVLLWIARYNGDPGNPGWGHPRLALHQHSDAGQVPGIPGGVDRNATVGGYTQAAFTL